MRRLASVLLLMPGVLIFVLSGCAIDKAQFRKNLLAKIDTGLQGSIEKNTPEYLDCFSGNKDNKVALFEKTYWECVWELDEKLPATVAAGSSLTRWVEELDACGTSHYVNEMFLKKDTEFQKKNADCSRILQGYYLVSGEEERHDIVVDAFKDIMIQNMKTTIPGLVTCFEVDDEIINGNIWNSYTEAIAPLTSKYLHRLPSDGREMQNDLDMIGNHFARNFYGRVKQFYSTAKLSLAEKKHCDAEILIDIQLSFPEFIEPVQKVDLRDVSTDRQEIRNEPKATSSSKERLIELKALYDENIITREEYNQKRKSIFDEL